MFQIQGILKEVTPSASGTTAQGTPWQKCDVIVEVQEGQYNTTYCFTAFNKDITIPVGSTVVVDWYVKSNNYNGKWFTNLNLYKIDYGVQQQTYQPPAQPPYNQQGYQQPMQQQGYQQRPPQNPTAPQRPVYQNPQPAGSTSQMPPQAPVMPPAPAPQQNANPVDEMNDLPF